MPRVKRGVTARARHKKILKAAKGYKSARSRVIRAAKQLSVLKMIKIYKMSFPMAVGHPLNTQEIKKIMM